MQCLLGLSLLSSSFAFSANKTILVFGDSLSAGYGIKQSNSWPSLLQAKLTDKNLTYRVANASVSGETTHGGLARFPATLKRWQPNLVIIALGANDGLQGLSMKAMKSNLQHMIDQSKKINAKILLLGMKIPSNYGSHYTTIFSAIYRQLSEDNDIPLVPFMMVNVSENSDLMLDDQLHPNTKGQTVVLANIWPSIQPMVSK